ncbi:sulfide:quinone oxidoreductase, mitochondrial-like [Panonychus citri]|uniref:sulfide:quinone oxidoreductase, mitochondrial-like n=1 Tax=Panonychus citri TaxID=50023 RepID=UPI002307EFB1|nr:sulfide:quinone oxidoreductase, mitochondrial-like [Panonychus citri]
MFSSVRYLSNVSSRLPATFDIAIVGGGTAGMNLAWKMGRYHKKLNIALIEPSSFHYYQPMWTLVGAGIKRIESSRSSMDDLTRNLRIVKLKDRAVQFIPEENCVRLESRGLLRYNYLIVCTGIELDFERIKGIKDALQRDNVCSNYSVDTVEKTWKCLQATKSGNAIFTFPNTPIKCAGAPQKIMYLADDHWRKTGRRDNIKIMFNSAGAGIFAVPKYAESLNKVVANRGIQTNFRHNLIEIKGDENVAIFEHLDSGDKVSFEYDMIHITPPQKPSPILAPIADQSGFVDVNKETLQHVKYENIFATGDCSNLPTSRTAAAVASQSDVLFWNLVNVLGGRKPSLKYDGYTSCPLITSYDKCILAEFDYDLKPKETFPIDQGKERRSMFIVKTHLMPLLYWLLHVTGRWSGPGKLRKWLRLGLSD